jgi:hypothetical protein
VSNWEPTTEDIRNDFARDGMEYAYMFDRWLVAERKRVAEMATDKERERIIKLLEEDQPCVLVECYPGDFCNCYQIALIKGENK